MVEEKGFKDEINKDKYDRWYDRWYSTFSDHILTLTATIERFSKENVNLLKGSATPWNTILGGANSFKDGNYLGITTFNTRNNVLPDPG